MKSNESHVKVYILTHGVVFTDAAVEHAVAVNAKRQNLVYNTTVEFKNGRRTKTNYNRPQELLLQGFDGYTVCASAVSEVLGRKPAIVNFVNGELTIETPAIPHLAKGVANITYVEEPAYYSLFTSKNRSVKRIISACGYDEMNLWPWHDCAVDKKCSFCGINSTNKGLKNNDWLHALNLRNENGPAFWNSAKEEVLEELTEAITLAIDDDCYKEEVHMIMISGNLDNNQLDLQAEIYSDMAKVISENFPNRFKEGIVAVTAPPNDLSYLEVMKSNGIEIGVFNLEVFTEEGFNTHCPGKAVIGRQHHLDTLVKGVEVFGWGKSWTNFVLGLENINELLEGCDFLAKQGINPSANVLHIDYGSSLKIEPPTYEDVIFFYTELASILKENKLSPYYCAKALRTSLSNEAFENRF